MPEPGSWLGTKIRKGRKLGKVVQDKNGVFRILTVQFEDGTKEEIWLANMGPSPKEVQDFEWFCKKEDSAIDQTWVRF